MAAPVRQPSLGFLVNASEAHGSPKQKSPKPEVGLRAGTFPPPPPPPYPYYQSLVAIMVPQQDVVP